MSELGDRAIGSGGALCSFGLFTLWVTDINDHYKYLAGCFAFLIVCLIVGLNVLKTRRLHKKRLEQIRLHHAEN